MISHNVIEESILGPLVKSCAYIGTSVTKWLKVWRTNRREAKRDSDFRARLELRDGYHNALWDLIEEGHKGSLVLTRSETRVGVRFSTPDGLCWIEIRTIDNNRSVELVTRYASFRVTPGYSFGDARIERSSATLGHSQVWQYLHVECVLAMLRVAGEEKLAREIRTCSNIRKIRTWRE